MKSRFLALTVTAALLAGACSSGATSAPSTAAPATSAVNGPTPSTAGPTSSAVTSITLITDKPGWKTANEAIAQTAKASGTTFDYVSYPDTATYQTVVRSSLASSKAPALFSWWSGYQLQDLAATGTLQDLTPLWQSAIASGDLPKSLAQSVTYNGKQYGIPYDLAYWPVFYNKHVFTQYGLTPPTTWDQLLAIAAKLKANGVAPFWASVTDQWPAFIWFQYLMLGSDPALYQKLMVGQASYTDPGVVQVLTVWKSLIDDGYFSKLDTRSDTGMPPLFASGKIAMVPAGTWATTYFTSQGMKPDVDYGYFMMPNVNPALTTKAIAIEVAPLAIGKNSPDAPTALTFANWWITASAQTQWSIDLGDPPANPKAQASTALIRDLVSTVNSQHYELVNRFYEATPADIVQAADNDFSKFMLNPNDANSVLQDIQNTATKVWAARPTP